MYLGYVHYRVVGATVVGVAFVLPSFLMVVAIGWAYLHFGGGHKPIYAICGQRVIDVARQQDADHYQIIIKATSASGSRSGLFSAAKMNTVKH